MKPRFPSVLLLAAAFALNLSADLRAQDNGRDGEPVDPAIDPAKLTYDILVDGTLPDDDPAAGKFRTIQAAYAAAPAGTTAQPTVIGIKAGVYLLPPPPGATSSLTITKDNLTFLGLTNNRRAVVLADNRGNRMGGGDVSGGSSNGYVVSVDANGFTAKNLTFLNYCNVDYEYPGDPAKNLHQRSAVITQAVALQTSPTSDRFVLENVALCSRLDTMFLRATRSWLKNVFLEGTDDFIGGGALSVWEDCRIVFPEGSGVMSASNVVFRRCRFEAERGLQFYKVEFGSAARPVALIECTLPVTSPKAPVAWVRGKAQPRPGQFSLTWHCRDGKGKPAVLYDSSVGAPEFAYTRELSDEEARAFNPWNVLRATPAGAVDDWDPAGARAKYEAAGQGSLVFRIALTGSPASVRTGGPGTRLDATVLPHRVTDPSVQWFAPSRIVTLARDIGNGVTVTGNNPGAPAWVPIIATAANGFRAQAWVFVEPKYLEAPKLTQGPSLMGPADGKVTVAYACDLAGHEDQSQVTWLVADDAHGTNAHQVAVNRGTTPLIAYSLGAGDVGKFITATVAPKHNISDPGPTVAAAAIGPIVATDVKSSTVSPNFRDFVTKAEFNYVHGRWTLLGTWAVVEGGKFVNGYGLRAASQGAQLLYQSDAKTGDMQVDLFMTPEKTEGMVFGSPGGPDDGERVQKSDIFIKYDPRTKNGYSLRFWRTTEVAGKCVYQFFRHVNGVGSPVSGTQVISGVMRPSTRLVLKVIGDRISVSARNDIDEQALEMVDTIAPNDFGGAGVAWFGTVPRGNSNVYSRFEISYPGTGR
ncbi:MAG TPA: pectinesterase family protein [Lacunisphaera sp.]|nr:pectinesterase family protein [Lacunisphaera sp.]